MLSIVGCDRVCCQHSRAWVAPYQTSQPRWLKITRKCHPNPGSLEHHLGGYFSPPKNNHYWDKRGGSMGWAYMLYAGIPDSISGTACALSRVKSSTQGLPDVAPKQNKITVDMSPISWKGAFFLFCLGGSTPCSAQELIQLCAWGSLLAVLGI